MPFLTLHLLYPLFSSNLLIISPLPLSSSSSSLSSSSSFPAPWWEWICPRRLLASWWRRSWTTLPWLWRNLRGPSWPSLAGKDNKCLGVTVNLSAPIEQYMLVPYLHCLLLIGWLWRKTADILYTTKQKDGALLLVQMQLKQGFKSWWNKSLLPGWSLSAW